MPKDTLSRKTFLKIPDEVINDPALSWSEKIIFSHIIRRSMQFGYCKEQQTRMADAIHIPYGTLKRCISSLHKKGYVIPNGKTGKYWNCAPIDVYKRDIEESPIMKVSKKRGLGSD